MFRLSVARDFVAQHYLTVPDPGPEGEVHSHHFEVAAEFAGPDLGEHGYLVDIDALAAGIDALVERYRDALLNDLPEFGDRNPSVERFARLFGDRLAERVPTDRPTRMTVRLWEDEDAWASHERSLPP
jgi:6-pyruvoyltetrahydropterin/6-carboxytetrahydropterin synthase